MERFRFLEHTADVLIEAYGSTLEEAFENAAIAVFEVITDTGKVEPREERIVSVEGTDLENLLYRWIEELLILHDSEGLVISRAKIRSIEEADEGYRLEATVWGEPFNGSRHEHRTIVKAMTYAQLDIRKEGDRWVIRFVVDI